MANPCGQPNFQGQELLPRKEFKQFQLTPTCVAQTSGTAVMFVQSRVRLYKQVSFTSNPHLTGSVKILCPCWLKCLQTTQSRFLRIWNVNLAFWHSFTTVKYRVMISCTATQPLTFCGHSSTAVTTSH